RRGLHHAQAGQCYARSGACDIGIGTRNHVFNIRHSVAWNPRVAAIGSATSARELKFADGSYNFARAGDGRENETEGPSSTRVAGIIIKTDGRIGRWRRSPDRDGTGWAG